jgi:hypothetical protein
VFGRAQNVRPAHRRHEVILNQRDLVRGHQAAHFRRAAFRLFKKQSRRRVLQLAFDEHLTIIFSSLDL